LSSNLLYIWGVFDKGFIQQRFLLSLLSFSPSLIPIAAFFEKKHLQRRQLMAEEIEDQQPSVRLSKVAVSETHGEDSPYFAGWKAYDENPYHELDNPLGVIQMGLAENQVSVCVYICVRVRTQVSVTDSTAEIY
jgi:hypothetical protein